uniref:Uncharacterized protein n=1 Tax=mine drainage metagenome TaxID=410659 RepID=E6PN88_9ZZZZ
MLPLIPDIWQILDIFPTLMLN